MAIQSINLGALPDGKGGDTLRSTATKINENFSNAAHAASKLVGTATNQIPLSQDTQEATFKNTPAPRHDTPEVDCNTFTAGSYNFVSTNNVNAPPMSFANILTIAGFSGNKIQLALGYNNDDLMFRNYMGSRWYTWKAAGYTKQTYTTTTAAGANVVVDATGTLMRSTSSERYKDIIAPLVLTDEVYNNAITLEPIVYRSTAEADNPLHHYYSFSAEQLGAFDKAFTLWRETETKEVIKVDEEGNKYSTTEEVPLAEPLAEGLNINALLAFSHAISVKQASLINDLEARLKALEDALAPKEV